jgi:membrane protease YdiL (CAAX protease family)
VTLSGPGVRGSAVLRAAWIFYLVLAVGGLVWLGWQRGRLALALFVDPGAFWVDLGLGLALGGLLLALWELARRRLPAAADLERRLSELLGPLGADEALALAFLSAVAEETFFRGALQGAVGWLLAALAFALLHLGPGPALRLWGGFAAVAGALFGALVLARESLLGAYVAHFAVNAVNLWRLRAAGRLATAP